MSDYPAADHKKLFQAILSCQNEKELGAFLRDVMTIKELDDIAKRWQIAQLLNSKKLSYGQIAKKYQVSTTTVTRVAHWLKHGMSGYKLVLKRMRKK